MKQSPPVIEQSWRKGKTTGERGYGAAWQKARRHYLAKYPLCATCQSRDQVTVASVVDHVIPHRGDMALFWESSNWQALCKPCHDQDKARLERGSHAIGAGLDGWPIARQGE